MKTTTYHQSVLEQEVLEGLSVVPGETYLDCTLGGGGHTERILDFGGKVIALDVDKDAINNALRKFDLENVDGVWVTKNRNLKIIKENFSNLDQALAKVSVNEVSGVLFDLGVSSFMFDTPERGFSFSKEGPLDMRMDQDLAVSARDLINGLNEGELYELFTRLGEVSNARRLARYICENRIEKRIETTSDLVKLIGRVVSRAGDIDPATKVFMALRIAVNDELNNLKTALPKATQALKVGGRLVVLSFHSLEDRIVKEFLKNANPLRVVTEKPIVAGQSELEVNRRARSVKMRVAQRQ